MKIIFRKILEKNKELFDKANKIRHENLNGETVREELVNNVSTGTVYVIGFMKWLLIALVAGLVCGLLGAFFYKSIEEVTLFRILNPDITYFLPVAGLAIVFIYRLLGIKKDKGTNLVLDSIHSHEQIPDVMAPLIYAGTVITHLFGGSSGREGAALQMGGCIGVFIGKKMKMSEKDINVLTMCGMSAVFTAMFGTPITATIFSMEVISVGLFHYSAFVPCIIASSVSLGVSRFFGISGETFTIIRLPGETLFTSLRIIALSFICGVAAILFCQCVHSVSKIFKKLFPNQYARVFTGGVIVCAFIHIADTQYYSGAGFNIIRDAFNGHAGVETVIIKLLLTAVTLGSGFKGGEIVPAIGIGASLGSIIAPLLGFEPAFGAGIGLVCLFCGVVNCPIASILLAMEMFGQHHLLPFAIASGVSYVFSGCFGLYNSQKILYSKIHAEYINTHTH